MPHPILIPIMVIPHVVIPTVMFYILHLERKESISSVRRAQASRRVQSSPSSTPVISNTISPLSLYICDHKQILQDIYYRMSYQRHLCQPKKTKMRELASTRKFQKELNVSVTRINENRRASDLWKEYYYTHVLPKLAMQRGIVMSKLRPFLMCSTWYSIISNELREIRYDAMQLSPMYKLGQSKQFQSELDNIQQIRLYERYLERTNKLRIVSSIEKDNIVRLARVKQFNRTLNKSPMHRFIISNNYHAKLFLRSLGAIQRHLTMVSSPLKVWCSANKYVIKQHVLTFDEIRMNRAKVLKNIANILAINYGSIYRKYVLKAFRAKNAIADVTLNNNCNNHAVIVFPLDIQAVDQFLSDSNLDGFVTKTIFSSTNHFQSQATSFLALQQGKDPTIDELTDAAQTFKNISCLSDYDTHIRILSESGKINIPTDQVEKCQRIIEIHFVKRDRKDFKVGQYQSCVSRVNEMTKRYPYISITVGFLGRWLSDTIIVTMTGPITTTEKYTNISTDMIQMINLVKGVIFAKMIDNTCWLSLPPLKDLSIGE